MNGKIYCNKCEGTCKGSIGNFNGLIEIPVYGAYDSTHLGDGCEYRFSLCEKCLDELFKSFKIEPFADEKDIF